MTTLHPSVSTPKQITRTAEHVSVERTLATLRAFVYGTATQAIRRCFSGSNRAIERKLRSELNVSLPDLVRLVQHRDGSFAAPLFRAMAADAGVEHRISISDCAPVERPQSLAQAENELTCAFSTFFADADAVRRNRRASSIEMRRLIEEEIGLEARSRAILNAPEMGADNA